MKPWNLSSRPERKAAIAVDSLITSSLWLCNVDMPASQCTPHSHPPTTYVGSSCRYDGEMQVTPEDGGYVGPLHSEKSHETCVMLP